MTEAQSLTIAALLLAGAYILCGCAMAPRTLYPVNPVLVGVER